MFELLGLDFTVLAAIFSILPDIDSPKSYAGNFFKPLSNLIFEKFAHRGLTHSLMALLIIIIISFLIKDYSISVAYFSHIFLDSFNSFGVMLFYPNNSRVVFFDLKVKSGSVQDSFLGLVFLSIFFGVNFWLMF
jgi:inner membrane protein